MRARKIVCGALFASGLLSACIDDGGGSADLLERGEEAFPGADLPVETAKILTEDGPRVVAIQRAGGVVVIDGDIVVDPRELEAARLDVKDRARGAITALSARRWSGGVIPYVIDPALPNPSRVTDAIQHWQAWTPFRLVARTTQTDFVRFAPGDGCSSAVGRQGGQQTITLATGCTTGSTIHEIGHTIGFWHEQQRADRDTYVTIHPECIEAGAAGNFSKYPEGSDVGPYDYRSVMHYPRWAFSTGCETITPGYANADIGQRSELSAGDVLTAYRIRFGNRPGVSFAGADYDGDKKTDIAIKDDTGAWRIDYAANGFGAWDLSTGGYGPADAHPVPADYDGDGKADLAIKSDSGAWFIDASADGYHGWNLMLYQYGFNDAHPVPADYDGDGKADLAVKTDGGSWLIDGSADGYHGWDIQMSAYGFADAHPVPADYDGDGKADLAIKTDGGWWMIDRSVDGYHGWDVTVAGYGASDSVPLPADYDGDGKADLAIKNAEGQWNIDWASDGFGAFDVWLTARGGWWVVPVPGDYDGDRKADVAVKEIGQAGAVLVDFAGDQYGAWNYVLPLGA